MKTYLVSDQHLCFDKELEVSIKTDGQRSYEGKLGGFTEWARAHNVDRVFGAVIDGQEHAVYPTIIATTPEIAAVLSSLVGTRVHQFDGWTYFRRHQALEDMAIIYRSCLVPNGTFVWAVSDTPKVKFAPEAPKPQIHKEELLPF